MPKGSIRNPATKKTNRKRGLAEDGGHRMYSRVGVNRREYIKNAVEGNPKRKVKK